MHRVRIGCSGWSYGDWRGGNYSKSELDDWRRRIVAWRSHRPVFIYLNNDWKGYAPANARYLRAGLSTERQR
jgi:uncharacterized protein YecE (DUF72 family)